MSVTTDLQHQINTAIDMGAQLYCLCLSALDVTDLALDILCDPYTTPEAADLAVEMGKSQRIPLGFRFMGVKLINS